MEFNGWIQARFVNHGTSVNREINSKQMHPKREWTVPSKSQKKLKNTLIQTSTPVHDSKIISSTQPQGDLLISARQEYM